MSTPSVHDRLLRARLIAWSLVAGAIVTGIIRLCQGCLPDQPLDFTYLWWALKSIIGDWEEWIIIIGLAAGSGVVLLFFLWIIGCSMRVRRKLSRECRLDSIEAQDRTNQALARLIGLGYRVESEEPLTCGGWQIAAQRRCWSPSFEPHHGNGQRVDFQYRSGTLRITHTWPLGWIDTGDAEFQEGFIDTLAAGTRPVKPTRWISVTASWFFTVSLVVAAGGIALHFMPEEWRESWHLSLACSWALLVPILAPFLWLSRRWTAGKDLAIPGLVLAGIGAFFWMSRRDTWQTVPWRTTDDPNLLCRAWLSSGRDCDSRLWPVPRLDAARRAHVGIKARLLTMGESGARGIINCARFESGLDLLESFGEVAKPALLDGLNHPSPLSRARSIKALSRWAEDSRIVARVSPLLKDAHSIVRGRAAEFFSGRKNEKPWPPAVRDPSIIDALASLLRDNEQYPRRAAAAALGHQRAAAAVPALIECLRSEADPIVRDAITEALVAIGDPRAIPVLIEGLDEKREWEVSEALNSFGAAAIDPLLDLLETDRRNLAHGTLRNNMFSSRDLEFKEETLRRLLLLAEGSDVERRRTSLVLLSRSNRPEALACAVNALKTPEAICVLAPLRARGLAAGEDLLRCLRYQPLETIILYNPVEEDKELGPALASMTEDPEEPPQVRRTAFFWLRRLEKERAVAIAERFLDSGPMEFHRVVVWPDLPTSLLLGLLDYPDPDVRLEAAEALASKEDPGTVPALIRVFQDQSFKRVQCTIAKALGLMRAVEAVGPLCRAALREPLPADDGISHWSLLSTSIRALGEIGDPRAQPVLRNLLQRAKEVRNIDIFTAAATAIGMTGDPEVVPILRDAIRWPHYGGGCTCLSRASCRAAAALARLGDTGAQQLLDVIKEWDRRDIAAEALGQTGSPTALNPLIEMLNDPHWNARRGAALGLGHLGDPRAIPALRRAAEDRRGEVAACVRWALQRLTGADFGVRLSNTQAHCVEGFNDRGRKNGRLWWAPRDK